MKKLLYFALSVSAAFVLGACAMFQTCQKGNAEKFAVNNIYGDHMVLQRNVPIRIVGTAEAGKSVNVTIADSTVCATANKEGVWEAVLPAMEAGGPYTVSVTGAEGAKTITFTDVLIGEVWLCSGQSNMQMPVWSSGPYWSSKNGQEETKRANYPEIRLYNTARIVSPGVERTATNGPGWVVCSPETVKDFSAFGFYFGRQLFRDLKIPIGLIHSSWGGTRIEAWISKEGFKSADRKAELSQIRVAEDPASVSREKEKIKRGNEKLNALFNAWYQKFLSTYAAETKAAEKWKDPDFDVSSWENAKVPGVIDPNMDGVVWFRRDIDIPKSWAGKDLRLSLGAVDDCDETFFNGVKVGATGPDVPNYWEYKRLYTIPGSLVKAGRNTLAVRVIDTFSNGGFTSPSNQIYIQVGDDQVQRRSLDGTWKTKVEFKVDPKKIGRRPSVTANYSLTSPQFPATLYNSMIAPWTVYPIQGILWYQGESNAGAYQDYMVLHPLLIKDWRAKWKNPNMPFIFAQLAAFERHNPKIRLVDDFWKNRPPADSDWAMLREVQTATLNVPNTGMAVAIDIGDHSDIHPADKQTLGYRAAREAERLAYNWKGVTAGPMYESMKIEGDKIRLGFTNVGKGLYVKGKELNSFAIAGKDGKFVWANARVEGNSVLVWADSVKNPVAVRYAWANYPGNPNLYNLDGFPACPFRTDTPDYLLKKKK